MPSSIERASIKDKDKKDVAYPPGSDLHAVDEKARHSQRVLNVIWIPEVWGRRPDRGDFVSGYRKPDLLLAWDDYIVRKTAAVVVAANMTQYTICGRSFSRFSRATDR